MPVMLLFIDQPKISVSLLNPFAYFSATKVPCTRGSCFDYPSREGRKNH